MAMSKRYPNLQRYKAQITITITSDVFAKDEKSAKRVGESLLSRIAIATRAMAQGFDDQTAVAISDVVAVKGEE